MKPQGAYILGQTLPYSLNIRSCVITNENLGLFHGRWTCKLVSSKLDGPYRHNMIIVFYKRVINMTLEGKGGTHSIKMFEMMEELKHNGEEYWRNYNYQQSRYDNPKKRTRLASRPNYGMK